MVLALALSGLRTAPVALAAPNLAQPCHRPKSGYHSCILMPARAYPANLQDKSITSYSIVNYIE
eukprot:SAG31_NODE_812_length_11915_cov_64.697360_1_plen_64_part_00